MVAAGAVGVMHAQVANLITCADPSACVQPGTREIPVSVSLEGVVLTLEFCPKHAETPR